MRPFGCLICLATILCASMAQSDPCSFTPQNPSTLPPLTGQVVYEDDNSGNLYMYDFKSAVLTALPVTTSWGLSAAENPVFSPDASAVLFSAVVNNARHLFYWPIGAAQPVNITAPMGNLRNEDPKFSPDGYHIVWKQDFGIEVGSFSFDDLGNPILFNTQQIAANPPEASGPTYSPSQKYIYYFIGSSSQTKQLQAYDAATGVTAPAFTQNPNVQYYYPVDPDLYDFIYVSWLPTAVACPQCDKIYLFSKVANTGTAWNATDCAADNSDPAPIDEDYFIYSRDNNTDSSQYELYVGQISTGNAWSLSSLGLNPSGGSFLGADYTNQRYVNTPAN